MRPFWLNVRALPQFPNHDIMTPLLGPNVLWQPKADLVQDGKPLNSLLGPCILT